MSKVLRLYVLPILLCVISTLPLKAQTLQTSGSQLLGPCGDTIVLHGVNYAPYSWGYDNNQLLLDQVAQTGANCVRMTWYTANYGAPYYTDQWLDTAIATCIRNKMIAVIELHDNTCMNDYDSLINLARWYLTPTHIAMFNRYNSSLIIDVANEAGYVNWDANPSQSQTKYQNAYDSIIHMFRRSGINVPIMIDAPDCGTSIDVFGNVASSLISSDPRHNLIFSAHAYWYAYANNDSATMRQDVASAVTHNYPLVLAEVADYQDGVSTCQFPLNYQALLHSCVDLNVGWLTWCWYQDNCTSRQMSTDGTYANLSTYGADFCNNTGYGLHHVSVLSEYLVNNQANCTTTGVAEAELTRPYLIYQNGGRTFLKLTGNSSVSVKVFDVLGRLNLQTVANPQQVIELSNGQNTYVGILSISDKQRTYTDKFVSNKAN